MKVLAFNGSPRTKAGATDLITQRFMDGAAEAGAEIETIYLSKQKINYCSGCFACWMVHPGVCIHKDDMAEILDKRTAADMLVFASPVYVDGFSAQMKTMMDRCMPLGTPFIVERDGHARHPGQARYKRKSPAKMVLITTCGFGEMDNFEPIVMHMRAMARNMAGEYLGDLVRPMGPALLMLAGMDPERAGPVLDAFRQAGYEAVSENLIRPEVREAAARSIMSRK
ncbi:MAG: flavodoxin family protein, partial [Proteobacteria bacterium]|nr:flavodoxin family protein [Pseudomonadota bacterium]